MRLVFWQNCLSIHQLPYIVHLINDERIDKVIIVSDCDIDDSRKKMGWNVLDVPNMEKCQIILRPSPKLIDELLKERTQTSYHLFSGIRAFKFVFDVFKQSLKYPVYRGIITEQPYTYAFGCANGKPLWLHKLRFYFQDYKYIPYIDSIFAIGEDCVCYYQSISKKWKVFPFIYCTFNKDTNHNDSLHQTTKFIFIGNLTKRKGVINLLKATNLLLHSNKFELSIVGDGIDAPRLKQYISNNQINNVVFLGTQPNEQIPSIIQEHDILILPSIYDGWGAVVNEALMQGKYVICSDKCGAKALLNNSTNGLIFKGGKYKELANKIQYCINNIATIREQEEQRKKWANKCIAGKTIAQYMIDCLFNISCCKPWL